MASRLYHRCRCRGGYLERWVERMQLDLLTYETQHGVASVPDPWSKKTGSIHKIWECLPRTRKIMISVDNGHIAVSETDGEEKTSEREVVSIAGWLTRKARVTSTVHELDVYQV